MLGDLACCHFVAFWLFSLTAADGRRRVLEVDQKAGSRAQRKINSFNSPSTGISGNVLPLTLCLEDLY